MCSTYNTLDRYEPSQNHNKIGHKKRTVHSSINDPWLNIVTNYSLLLQVYVCHALWDSQYETLTALLDRPSPLLANNEGIFDAMFREMDNITIDVSVKDVLR